MCRLFGLHADTHVATATFWLLGAPDSLSQQSHRNPDGTGLGVFEADGTPVLHKEPIAAWQDTDFATEAHDMTGTTFVAHVRYASTGSLEVRNTHPFLQDGRIFAHNGVVEGLDVLDARLRELGVADLVLGETDSERIFALITACIRSHDGDIGAGIVDAVGWLAATVPIYAVNLLLSTATDMWALRFPEPNELYILDRYDAADQAAADGEPPNHRAFRAPHRSSVGHLRQRADGRRPPLAASRSGRAGARRRGSGGHWTNRVPRAAEAAAAPRRPDVDGRGLAARLGGVTSQARVGARRAATAAARFNSRTIATGQMADAFWAIPPRIAPSSAVSTATSTATNPIRVARW